MEQLAHAMPALRPATAERRRALFEEAVETIERSYEHERLTVADVARSVFASKRQLQRAFTEAGTSFQETLHAIRMERAAELIVDSSLTISAIASQVGYRQPTQFAKAFRRYYRLAPTQLRNLGPGSTNGEVIPLECKCGCDDPPAPPEGGQPLPRPKRDEHERDLSRRLEKVDRRLQELEKAA